MVQERFPIEKGLALPCEHYFDYACWRGYLGAKLADGPSQYHYRRRHHNHYHHHHHNPLPWLRRRWRADCVFAHCPATDCREPVSEDIWKRVLKHNSEQLERYSSFLVHSYIELNPSLKLGGICFIASETEQHVQVVSLSQVQQGRVLHRQRDRPSLRLRLQDVLRLQRGRAFTSQLPDGTSVANRA